MPIIDAKNVIKTVEDNMNLCLDNIPEEELFELANAINAVLTNGVLRTIAMTPAGSFIINNPASQFNKDTRSGRFDDIFDRDYEILMHMSEDEAKKFPNEARLALDLPSEYLKLQKNLEEAYGSILKILNFKYLFNEADTFYNDFDNKLDKMKMSYANTQANKAASIVLAHANHMQKALDDQADLFNNKLPDIMQKMFPPTKTDGKDNDGSSDDVHDKDDDNNDDE